MEELNIEEFIKKFENSVFSPLKRALLATDGTVQTFLSVILMKPVKAVLLLQKNFGNFVIRWVRLETIDGEVVGKALSIIIPTSSSKAEVILKELSEGKIGLGQAIKKYGLSSRRMIHKIYYDRYEFGRIYSIENEVFSAIITEIFPNNLFEEIENGR